MRTLGFHTSAALILLTGIAVGAEENQSPDLRRAVPADAYLAIHQRHNPERDYQRAYHEEIWDTIVETRIIERAVKIATDRLSEADVEKAKSIIDELRTAAEPFDLEAVSNAKETVYAQFMVAGTVESKQPLTGQHLVLIRVTPEAAASCEEAVKNLLGLVEKYSEGQLPVRSMDEGDTSLTTLMLPPPFPFRPTVARLGDVLLLSSSEEGARRSLAMLGGAEGESKFDDPRLRDALAKLPKPEDSLVFYDGRQQFSQMRGIAEFIRQIAQGEPEAERIAGLIELLFDEVSIPDYEVTVEYTEGNLNRTASYGRLVPGYEDKLLAKVLWNGEPFEDWRTWVPSDALSYSLWTGINLHPVYEKVVSVIEERIPEAKPGLEKFEQIQSDLGVYLDRDLLQAFSGESVSVSLPAANPATFGGQDSVTAVRCHKPDRIRQLIHRLMHQLNEIPAVAMQQLALVECADMEGFEELRALPWGPWGIRPVIGFRDGWMFVGSTAQAVKTVLDTRAGEGDLPISDTEDFKRFNLQVDGPVYSIKYGNTAESTRQIAKVLNQAGMMAPMIIAMAGAKADPEAIEPFKEAMGLLPSAAQIVSRFDFLEAKLSVSQAGDEPGSVRKQSVTVVRPPESQEK